MVRYHLKVIAFNVGTELAYRPQNCETFALGDGIIPFGRLQRATGEALSIVAVDCLREHCSKASIARVCLNNELMFKRRPVQHRG